MADRKANAWLVALIAAAGTTLAPTAFGQDEDPIAGMLRSLTDGGVADPINPARNQVTDPGLAADEVDLSEFVGDVKVDENMIVELHVQDEALANVLQMLSIQSQRNIVTSRNVSATVTANLYGVTFYEALDAILHVNGYGYVEQGNFIYVYTLEEMKTIEQAARLRVAKAIHLNFLNAVDAAEFVTPLLSEGGFIKTNGRTAAFQLSGDLPVGADDFANGATMVVFDYPENIEEIERLISELDTRPAQVLVEATIVQTTLNEANAFGVDFSIVADLNIEDFLNAGGPLGPVDGLLGGVGEGFEDGARRQVGVPGDGRGRAIQSTPGNTDGPATLKLGLIDDDVSVFVRMLDEVSDTTILSNPKILALNRQPSRVLVGRKVGYLSTTATQTSTTQTVEFLDTGTQLIFRPFVSNDGLIRMELKPQVSEAIIRNQTDVTGAAVTIPDEITNEITTNVLVPDGHTIVLGGLFREATTASRRQVPVLGDLPLIGAAFRGHEDETQRSEIIFLIKPSIVADEVLIAQGGRGQDYVRRVRAGSREGLLPWSRERQSAQLLVEAEQLAAEGKTDRALYAVRRALEHNPFQPDAISMRERLMNEHSVQPTRSLLGDIIEDDLFDASIGTVPRNSMDRRSSGSYAPVDAPVSTSGSAPVQTLTPTPVAQQVPVQVSPAPNETTSTTRSLQPTPVATTAATPMASQPSVITTPQGTVVEQTWTATETSEVVTPVYAPAPVAVEQPVVETAATTPVPANSPVQSDGVFRPVSSSGFTATNGNASAQASNPYANLRPTPVAAGQAPVQHRSVTAGLAPTMAPVATGSAQQAGVPASMAGNNPFASLRPTGQNSVHGAQPAAAAMTASVALPVQNEGTLQADAAQQSAFEQTLNQQVAQSYLPASGTELNTTAALNSAQVQQTQAHQAQTQQAQFQDPWQRPEGFDLSDADVQMLLLTEFFRSFGNVSVPTNSYTEVPTQTPE
jgi:type IV pilus assembly protein PilQ